MSELVSLMVLPVVLLLGVRWPGVLLAGCLCTYQAGALANLEWLGSAYIAAAAALVWTRWVLRPWRLRLTPADAALAGLLLYLVVSNAWAPARSDAGDITGQLMLSVAGMVLIGRLIPGTPRQILQEFVFGLAAVGAVLGLCMIGSRITDTAGGSARLLIANENATAVGLAMPFPYVILASVLIAFFATRRWIVGIGVLALGIVLYTSVLSATRSVFLAAGLGIAVALLLAIRRIGVSRAALFGIAAISVGFIALQFLPDGAFDHLVRRFAGSGRANAVGSDASSVERLYLWHDSLQMFTRHPFVGTGYGSFGYYSFGSYPHNMLLEIASTAGVVGLILLLGWLTVLALQLWRAYRADAVVGSVIIGLFIVALLQMQVSFAFSMARPLFLISALAPLLIRRSAAATIRETRARRHGAVVAPRRTLPTKTATS